MTKFIQGYVYFGKDVDWIVKTRMRQYNEIKIKTTQVIWLDPKSLTQHIKQANVQAYLGYGEVWPMFIWLETWIRNWNSYPFVVWLQSIAADNEQSSKAQCT